MLIVKWKDHAGEAGWKEDVKDFHSPALVKSVGWLLKEDDEGITLSGARASDGSQISQLQYLLKSCIIKRTVVKE